MQWNKCKPPNKELVMLLNSLPHASEAATRSCYASASHGESVSASYNTLFRIITLCDAGLRYYGSPQRPITMQMSRFAS
jgi:hypothetical protein